MQFEGADFNKLVNTFYTDVCNTPYLTETYWIIKLTNSRDDGTPEGRTRFLTGAARNQWESHAERVFTDWWDNYQDKTKHDSLEVYTNYTPCTEYCAPLLTVWVRDNKIKLTIHYAFVYINPKMIEADRSNVVKVETACVSALDELKNAGNGMVKIRKLTKDALASMAKVIGFADQFDYTERKDYCNYHLEARINSPM